MTCDSIIPLEGLQNLVSPSRTWKIQGWWFRPHLPVTLSCQCRRQMDHGEWQLTTENSIMLWLQLQLLYQMWYPHLSINTSSGTWHEASDQPNAFFRNLYRRTNRNNFSTGKTSNTFTVLPHITCPALGHNLIKRDLDNLFLPQNITMVYYIDNITLIGSSEQEMAITLDLLVTHIH